MLREVWKFNREATYSIAALHAYWAFVQLNNGFYNSQTDSVAVTGVGLISLIKLIPDFIDFIFWDVLSVICYADCAAFFVLYYVDFYLSGIRGELSHGLQGDQTSQS